MWQLFKSEFLRFRNWALGFSFIHLSYWVFINTLSPNLQISPRLMSINQQSTMTAVVTLGTGFLFGVLQMGLHRRVNHWTYLIHRPVAQVHIYIGLATAALVLLSIVFFGPWFIMVTLLDVFSPTVVELRHYLHGFYMVGLAFGAYLCGSFTQLHPSRGAFLVTVLMVFLIGHPPYVTDHAPSTIATVFLLFVIVLTLLVVLNLKAFKPDLKAPVTAYWFQLLMAIPMQIALVYGLFFLANVSYLVLIQFRNPHPHKSPDKGTERQFRQFSTSEGIAFLLADLPSPMADYLINQVKLGDVNYSGAIPVPYSIRNQMYFHDKPLNALFDEESESFWVFSHREMLLKGTNRRTGKSMGWLGKSGFKTHADEFTAQERFQSIPNQSGNQILQLPQVLYKVNFSDKTLEEIHRLGQDESYYSSLRSNEHYASIATDKNLLLFDREEFSSGPYPVTPDYRVPHPRPVKYLSHIMTVRLVDGYLLRYGNDYYFGGGRPGVALIKIKLDGTQEQLLEREFTDFMDPAYIRFGALAISPLLEGFLQQIVWRLIEPNERRHLRITLKDVPKSLWIAFGITGCICSGIAFGVGRSKRLNGLHQVIWVIMNLLVGIPALISFFLLLDTTGSGESA